MDVKLTKQQLKEIIRTEIRNLTESNNAYKTATKLELQQYLVNLNTELRGETDSKKIKILKSDINDVKKELQLRLKPKKESITEASRRANDFFGDSKHGIALHKLLGGKWNGKKVGAYLDKMGGGSDVKWARAMDFISKDAGLDTHKFSNLEVQERELVKALETLYKDFLSESTNEVISGLKRNDNIDGLGRYEYIVGDYTIDISPMGRGQVSLHIIKKGYGGYLFDTPKRFTSEKDAETFIKSVLPKIKKGEMGKTVGFKR